MSSAAVSTLLKVAGWHQAEDVFIARERHLKLDDAGFEAAMEEQRRKSRDAGKFGADYGDKLDVSGATEFHGYEHLVEDSSISALFNGSEAVSSLQAGDEGRVILTHTPFYAESGGQIGDTGLLREGNNIFRVLDTRKTTPGMRILEKMAVKIGGGVNHRIGLFDMILLKDNHVDFAGGIDKAITRAKEYCKEKGKDLKIEIEVRNFDELQQVLDLGGVDRIMFDNFTPEMTKKAVEMVAGRYETESSGGITFDTLRDYAECGVDFISVGALTHSVKGLDMSFKAC